MMYIKQLSFFCLIFVIGPCQIEAHLRKQTAPLGKQAPNPTTQKKFLRKASAPGANGFELGKESAMRYTKKGKPSTTTMSARDSTTRDASIMAVKQPIEVSLQKTGAAINDKKKATSNTKKAQKGSSRKNTPSFEQIVAKTTLTMKQRS